jgi:probable phosphoglycerate mutase
VRQLVRHQSDRPTNKQKITDRTFIRFENFGCCKQTIHLLARASTHPDTQSPNSSTMMKRHAEEASLAPVVDFRGLGSHNPSFKPNPSSSRNAKTVALRDATSAPLRGVFNDNATQMRVVAKPVAHSVATTAGTNNNNTTNSGAGTIGAADSRAATTGDNDNNNSPGSGATATNPMDNTASNRDSSSSMPETTAAAHTPSAKAAELRTRIYVARHAEHVESSSVARLSRRGSLQASAVAKTLRRHKSVSIIYSSSRCRETAEMIAVTVGVPIVYDDRLRNWDGGKLAALSLDEIKTRYPEIYQKRYLERDPDVKVPGGESLKERFDRVKSMLEDISTNCVGKSVVLVTHGGIIDDMYRMANNTPLPRLTGLLKPYGCLSVLSKTIDGPWQFEQWADVNHLPHVVAESPSGGHLYLFPHQVAGSCPMLRGDRGELCKPANSVELAAYQNVAKVYPQLTEFLPAFMGTVDIDVKHILSDKMSLSQPLNHMPEPLDEDDSAAGAGIGVESSAPGVVAGMGSAAISNDAATLPPPPPVPAQGEQSVNLGSETERGAGLSSATRSNDEVTKSVNSTRPQRTNASSNSLASLDRRSCSGGAQLVPDGKLPFSVTNLWTVFTAERWKKVMPSAEGDGRYIYLILENLSHGLRKPHILDLKIGTRQHGRFDSPEKQQRKQERCDSTTSATMGLRLAGMQKWSSHEKRFVLKDKYWGRVLKDQELEQTLIDFVNDDSSKAHDVDNDTRRPVLLGGDDSNGAASCSDVSDNVYVPTPRVAVVKEIIAQLEAMMAALLTTRWRFFGSSILIVFDSEPNEHSSGVGPGVGTAAAAGGLDGAGDRSGIGGGRSSSSIGGNKEGNNKRRGRTRSWSGVESPERVQVRLIDFSHCDRDVDHYTSHDEGVVFGLRNLIRVYKSLLVKHAA